jgi:hypothetical protein
VPIVEKKSLNYHLCRLPIDQFIAVIVGQKGDLRDLEDRMIAPTNKIGGGFLL